LEAALGAVLLGKHFFAFVREFSRPRRVYFEAAGELGQLPRFFFDGTRNAGMTEGEHLENELQRSGRLCTKTLNCVGRSNAEPEFVER
jgi:hypothetical protein